jgi:hypothetical protein
VFLKLDQKTKQNKTKQNINEVNKAGIRSKNGSCPTLDFCLLVVRNALI